jgi:SsrA-binding protein
MAGKKGKESSEPRQIQNRRARFDYAIEDTVEAGIALIGSEVKSVFLGRAHLTDAFCRVINGEMWLLNFDIEPYEHASHFGHDRRRDRKLLLHRRQIEVLARKAQEKGLALVPLRVYFNRGRVKVEVALARGKAQYDKRVKISEQDTRREIERVRSTRF